MLSQRLKEALDGAIVKLERQLADEDREALEAMLTTINRRRPRH